MHTGDALLATKIQMVKLLRLEALPGKPHPNYMACTSTVHCEAHT